MKVYLDNSATTAVDIDVVKEMLPYFSDIYGNASSFHSFGRNARTKMEKARSLCASLINAKPEEIYFTGCGTEADNIALLGIAEAVCPSASKRKGHIITTKIEHHAVLYTSQKLEKLGFDVSYLSIDQEGFISLDELKKTIRDDTFLISIMHANNEIGTLQPIEKVSALLKEINKDKKNKIYLHSDCVQTAGKMSIDVQKMGVDALAVSAHKFNGPKGVGFLYVKSATPISPVMFSGHHEGNLRPGTENTPYIIGIAKALELSIEHMESHQKQVLFLREKLKSGILQAIPEVLINGSAKNSIPHILNVSFKFIEGEALLARLDAAGIAVSTGSACATGDGSSHVLAALGIDPIAAQGAIRFSLGHANTEQEIDYVLSVLPEITLSLRKMSPLWKGN